MNSNSTIFVAGHNGMVGSAIVNELLKHGYSNLLLRSSTELDLTNQDLVNRFFERNKVDFVFLCAAKVGGIKMMKTNKTDFFVINTQITNNVVMAAFKNKVKKLVHLSSSNIYSMHSDSPFVESDFSLGQLDPDTESYALAKIFGMKLIEYISTDYNLDYFSVVLPNVYGPVGNFNVEFSTIIPSLIYKFHQGKINNEESVEVWGSGDQIRDFIYLEDVALNIIELMKNYNERGFVNVTTRTISSIKEIAVLIKKITNFQGNIVFNENMPEGILIKVLDDTKFNKYRLKGFKSLEDGLRLTYKTMIYNRDLS